VATSSAAAGAEPPGAAVGEASPAPPGGAGDWRLDAPGRRHRIDPDALPPPYATPSADFRARVIDRPVGTLPRVPAGFGVSIYATHLLGPRRLTVAPNGDVLVSETRAGQLRVLRPAPDGTAAAAAEPYATRLDEPFGIALYPAGPDPQWLYVAETNRVVRFAYRTGDRAARGVPEVVIPELAPSGGGHYTRDLAFSADGHRLYVAIGSRSNVATQMSRKSAAEIAAWEAVHGVGAAWGDETNRAAVRVFELDPRGLPQRERSYATGLRNCSGLTLQPATGALWCTTNERDGLGDDLVPDYSTRVREGGFYGWPWYYFGAHEDPRHAGERPDLAARAVVPDVPYQSHSAPLGLAFYPVALAGDAAFPPEYAGDGFAALHGSWNRAVRTGYKVVRVRMRNGIPTGDYEDFMLGLVADDAHVWGRPVGIAVAADGALLVSDDGGNVIWRIAPLR